jgi:hypothetical protein
MGQKSVGHLVRPAENKMGSLVHMQLCKWNESKRKGDFHLRHLLLRPLDYKIGTAALAAQNKREGTARKEQRFRTLFGTSNSISMQLFMEINLRAIFPSIDP